MKRIFSVLLIVFLCLSVLAGCQNGGTSGADIQNTDGGSAERLQIVATIFPQYDFVREIAGDKVALTMLLPPGSESHSYEPTPQDIIAIQDCDVFIYVGGESDTWVDDILASVDTGNMEIIALTDLVSAVEEEVVVGMENDDAHEDEDHSEEGGLDEHVWTSPKNAMAIVQAISDALARLDKDNAAAYRTSTEAYLALLEDLDGTFREIVDGAARNTLIFADRFPFRYLADEYGLRYSAAFPGCSTETEASAATVAFLIERVAEEDIPVVFYIEFSNQKMADTISESTDAKALLLHSCHNVTKDDFENGVTYLTLMNRNTENLREALQ